MTSILIVKRAVVNRCKAIDELTGVQVRFGHPYPAPPEKEVVLWGDAPAGDPTNGETPYGAGQRSAALGALHREERYVLQGFVVVTRHNSVAQETLTERAVDICQAIEDSMRPWNKQSADWPLLPFGGPSGVHWIVVAGTELAEGVDNESKRAVIHIELAVAARI